MRKCDMLEDRCKCKCYKGIILFIFIYTYACWIYLRDKKGELVNYNKKET